VRYGKMLEGAEALITGGASGIGAECARLFASHGARVTVADADVLRGEKTVASLPGFGALAHEFIFADFRDTGSLSALGGSYGVWVNSAGLYRAAYADELDDNDFYELLAVNLTAPIALTEQIIPEMARRGGGSAVLFCGEYALSGHPGVSGYAASKGGLLSAANAFASEYKGKGVRVNCVLPGANAGFMREHTGGGANELHSQYLPRRCENIEAANLALFLASDMSKSITGEAVFLSGGQHLIPENNTFPSREERAEYGLRTAP